MAQKDIHNNVKFVNALNITAIASDTTTNGNIIDTEGFEGVEVVIKSGTITDGTYTPAIYQSSDPTFATDVQQIVAPLLIGTTNVVEPLPSYGSPIVDPIADVTFVTADGNKIARIGVLNKKRYIRLSIVSTGVTTGGTFSADVLLGYPWHAPTSKDK